MNDEQLIEHLAETANRIRKTVEDIETVIGMLKRRIAIDAKAFADAQRLQSVVTAAVPKLSPKPIIATLPKGPQAETQSQRAISANVSELKSHTAPTEKPAPGLAAAMANQADRILQERKGKLTERQLDHLEAVKEGKVRLDMQKLPLE